jgi:undecaprenyl-diphosphatase
VQVLLDGRVHRLLQVLVQGVVGDDVTLQAPLASSLVPAHDRHPRDLVIAAVGLIVLAACCVVARDGDVPQWETDVFHSVNDLPEWLNAPLWPFQQFGNLLIGPVVALIAWLLHRRRLAAAALTATVLKLVTERIVKVFVERQRPGTSIGSDVILRGDVHASGLSFVSGHAVMVFAIAAMLSPYLHRAWKFVPWVLASTVLVARTYVGAHNPLDVIGGAALGLAIGSVLKFAFALGSTDGPVRTESATQPS